MSGTDALVAQIKLELKAAGMTYAALARELGMAESSVKRMLARADMPLQRVDAICRALGTDFAELARQVADAAPRASALTHAQERAVVSDRRLLLVALCVISQWSAEQIMASYRITEAELVKRLAQLDRLGLIELRPGNRYRLKVAKTFRWRPHGPVMQFFRERVMAEYFEGGFEGDDELMLLVHGQLAPAQAQLLARRLARLAEDFSHQHALDQHLGAAQKKPYTLMLGMRSWLFSGLREFRR